MARNKFPEETERRILEVSRRLFTEKGYEHTTIQDIVDALGMSKGAIYHHFKSKEDIYDRICDSYYGKQSWMRQPNTLPGENALEKARYLFRFMLSDPEKLQLDRLIPNTEHLDPRLLEMTLRSTIADAAPLLTTLIEAGNADGSLHIDQPRQVSESFMVLMNLWVGNCTTDKEDFLAKLRFMRRFSDQMGLPVIDDELFSIAERYFDFVMPQ